MDQPFKKYDISSIKDKILSPALTSHFFIQLTYPGNLKGFFDSNITTSNNNFDYSNQLNLLCSEASLPGSSLNTHENNNDFAGVTERFAYRRVYDDRIELTFYVDAQNYTPIRFFEAWIKYISGERVKDSNNKYYSYKFSYPDGDDGYRNGSKLNIYKFERDYQYWLSYDFIGVYPISIVSMPVSYDTSSLLKCTVHMTYLRYIVSPQGKPPTDDLTGIAPSAAAPANPPAPLEGSSFFKQGFTISDIALFNGNPNLNNVLLQQPAVTVNPTTNFSPNLPTFNQEPLF